MSASAAIPAYGTTLQISLDSGSTYQAIAEVTQITGADITSDTPEVTHLLSPGSFKEYVKGMTDGGSISANVNFILGEATQADVSANMPTRLLRICWPDFGTKNLTFTFSGGSITTGSAHGWKTGQPVRFTTAGTLPTGITANSVYFLVVTGTTGANVYPTPVDAAAATNEISMSGGSGTFHVLGGSEWRFNSIATKFTPQASTTERLAADLTFKLSGPNTFLP